MWRKTQDQKVKPRDKQETPEERGEKHEGELRCQKCNGKFRQEATWKNHSKACKGGRIEGEGKECRICNNLVGRANYARHVRSFEQRNNVQEERETQDRRSDQTERVYQREQYTHIAVKI